MAKKEKTGKRDYHYSMNHSTFGDDLYMCDIDSYSVEYISDDGDKEWYLNDKLHREDGPAIECASGTKSWYLNGKLHRVDGPAIECANGAKYWYLNDKLHREDGPAIEWANGNKIWYLNGKCHREDGPAIEHADGAKEWYVDGEQIEVPNNDNDIFLRMINLKVLW